MISAIEKAREDPMLTVESLRSVFAEITVVHRQDILPSTNKDKHDLKSDFAGAVAGRGRGKGRRSGDSRYRTCPEVLLADFALIRLIRLNLGGLATPCLARRGLERGLDGLLRRFDERKLVVAGNSVLHPEG